MTANQHARSRVTIELMVAGGIMIFTAASLAGLALVTTEGSPITLTPSSIGALAFALVLAASGVEAVRRRHFLFVVLVPAALALLNLGYVIGTGQAVALPSVAIIGLVAILVYSQRLAFRD